MKNLYRFKFRAWDKDSSKMIYAKNPSFIDDFLFEVMEEGIFLTSSPDYESHSEKCDAIIMQCTGLKDKNDKLIYEGDIIKKWSFNKNKNDFSDGKPFKVHWCPDGLGWNLRDPKYYKNKFEYEVVGNIYENPELINL